MTESLAYTVVIPAWNAERFIAEALASARGQTIPPAAIIVVDDGSTDGTANAVRAFDPSILVLTQANAGCGAATSLGMRAVTTPFTAFIDADDIWYPDKSERQFARFADDPALDGVFGHAVAVPDGQTPTPAHRRQPVWGRTCLMIRTGRALAVGDVIDPPGGNGDMIDWIDRARLMGLRLDMMDDEVAIRRVHKDSMTFSRNAEADRGYLAVARAALERRRARSPS